jgi:hypothetical protein
MYDAEQFYHLSATTNFASGLSSHAAYSVSRYSKTFFKLQPTVSNWTLFINTAVRASSCVMRDEESPNSHLAVKLIGYE